MATKKPRLDSATVELAKRLMSMPPKLHSEAKVRRTPKEEKQGTKASASSSKRHTS